MKILTWNINGIRAVKKDQPLKKLFDSLDADIICLQETKITREMLEEETAIVEGYNAYFSFSKVRSGYSGVATFCRNHVTPVGAEDRIHLPVSDCDDIAEDNLLTNGTSHSVQAFSHCSWRDTLEMTEMCDVIYVHFEELESLNAEGRTVLTEHLDTEGNHVVIINLYCPRAELDNKERTEFKLKFYSLVQKKCKCLIQENKHVIVLGDFNVSHKLIDHCDPNDPKIFDSNPSRQWASTFIWDPSNDEPTVNPSSSRSAETQTTTGDDESCEARKTSDAPQTTKFIDTFRYFHPDQKSAFTCWSTLTGARQTNYGTRIDYIFSSVKFFKTDFTECVIRPDIEGSDHCPVVATLKSTFRNAAKPPPLCTKYMPEFSGKQQKLKDFFKKSERNANISNLNASGNRTKENTKLVNVNESKSGLKDISADKTQLKSSDKRHAQSTLRSQAKRLKTNTGASQGKIFQFFEKKNTKPKTDSNKQTDCSTKVVADSLANTNESDSGISEERSETVPHLNIHNVNVELCSSLESTNTSSQTSTSSACSDSDYSTKSSSQNATQSSGREETQQTRSQNCSKEQRNSDEKSAAVVSSWKNILKGLPPAPLCSGHKEPCVLRTVKNKGANHGKQFYCCARPQGHSTNKEARCNDFKWLKKQV